MKIRMTVTVNLEDPQQWTTTFGTEGAQEIREDVKEYIKSNLLPGGVFGNGEVDATFTVR